MRLLKQSSTAQPLMFFLAQSADHITGLTSATATATLSKSGAGFVTCSGAISEVANGWYKVAGNATDTGTLGPLILHATATSADPTDVEYAVVAFDPQIATNLGLSGIPTASPGAASGVLIAGSNAATSFTGNVGMAAGLTVTQSTTNTGAIVATGNGTGAGMLLNGGSTASGLVLNGGGTTAPLGLDSGGTELVAIAGPSTISLPGVTVTSYKNSGNTTFSGAMSLGSTLAVTGATTLGGNVSLGANLTVAGNTTFIGNLTGTLSHVTLVDTITTYTGNSLQTGDNFVRIGAAGAGLTALGDTRIANLDATVSSRLATSGYTAPDNTTIASIASALTTFAAKFTGITLVKEWLGMLAGKQVGNTTARTEIRATGAASGTFDETTDSQEAIRDRGDAAWTTGSGGGGGSTENSYVSDVQVTISDD